MKRKRGRYDGRGGAATIEMRPPGQTSQPPLDPKDRFLASFEAPITYLSVVAGCEAAGVDVATFKEWMRTDPEFSELVKGIRTKAGEKVQAEAIRLALGGNEVMIRTVLKALLPDVYGDHQTVDLNITRRDIDAMTPEELKEARETCLKLAKS